MARELSRTPLPPAVSLNDVFNNPSVGDPNGLVKGTIYDPAKLVWNFSDAYAGGFTPAENSASLPIVNRLLLPLMINDYDNQVLRYPGLVSDPNNPGNWVIAKVTYSTGSASGLVSGSEQSYTLVPVVEEIVSSSAPATSSSDYPNWSPFNVTATDVPASQRGLVGVRINYPFQAVSLSYYTTAGTFIQVPASESGEAAGTYAGPYGLGNQLAVANSVRPFRRLMSAQAIYRREVFGP